MKNKILILIVMILMCTGCAEYLNEQRITCTVNDKWIKRYDDNEVYLISCDDEVYKIEDLFYKGKFNSSNLYAGLKKGKKYEIVVTGYRLPFLSEYQNINKYKEIKRS